MTRRFFSTSIEQLEIAFDQNRTDATFLRELLAELGHRSTQRSEGLKSRALTALGVLPKSPATGTNGDPLNTTTVSEELLARSIRCARERFSGRAESLLRKRGIRFLGELAELEPGGLRREPNVGRSTVAELEGWLKRYGFRFGTARNGWTPELAFELTAEAEAWAIATDPQSAPQDPKDLAGALYSRLQRAGATDRNVQLVARHHGWDGQGGATLEETAHPYAMTRERVRQISKKFSDRLGEQSPPASLVSILEILSSAVPGSLAEISARLEAAGLLPPGFDLYGVRSAAGVFGLPFPFEFALEKGILVGNGDQEKFNQGARLARKLCGRRGCVHLADLPQLAPIFEAAPDLSRTIVEALGFEWLSDDGWFWRPGNATNGRNRLVNNIELAIAAAKSLDVSELRSAVRRHHRMRGFAPPSDVLLEICRRLPFLEVRGRLVTSQLSRAVEREILGGKNTTLLELLREGGPVHDRLTLLERALARGMNENSFNLYLSYSPVIWRPAPGIYAALGAELPPGIIEARRALPPNSPTRTLESEWVGSRVRIVWRLERGSVLNGIVGLPKGFLSVLQGRWTLVGVDGDPLGATSVQEATVWNLRRSFRQLGAEAGDVLELLFDPEGKVCRVRIGDLEQIESEPADDEDEDNDE